MTPNPHPDHPLIGYVGSTFSIRNPTSPPNLLVSLLAEPQSPTRYYESLLIALFAPALAPTPGLSHRFPGYLNGCKLDFSLYCFPAISQQFYPKSSLGLISLCREPGICPWPHRPPRSQNHSTLAPSSLVFFKTATFHLTVLKDTVPSPLMLFSKEFSRLAPSFHSCLSSRWRRFLSTRLRTAIPPSMPIPYPSAVCTVLAASSLMSAIPARTEVQKDSKAACFPQHKQCLSCSRFSINVMNEQWMN